MLPRCSLFVFTAGQIFGQQVGISLSSASATPGSIAALTVSTWASGGVRPAILQWTVEYPADVTGIDVSPGPAAVNAGKNITCSYLVSVATCVAWGENQTTIADGAVATATFQISAISRNSSIAINSRGSASDGQGNSLPVSNTAGMINLILPPVITCAPNSGPRLLNQYYSAQCSVSLHHFSRGQ